MTTSRYSDLPREELIRLLERRDARRSLGLVWERERIARDNTDNDDFIAFDLDATLSSAPSLNGGWQNLIIEGDNWDALRALRLTHAGRVKCILIDPPYNTGNKDFAYNDSFVGKEDRYRQSVWLEFLYRRLLLARDLLTEDGVILVCINDENRALLDLLMQQVFPGMRLGSFVWRTKDTANNTRERAFSSVHEHVLVFCNRAFRFVTQDGETKKFKILHGDTIPSRLDPITMAQNYKKRANTYYPLQNPATSLWYPCSPLRVWSIWSTQKPTKKKNAGPPIEKLISEGRIVFPEEKHPPFFYASMDELIEAIRSGRIPRDGKGRPLLEPDLPDLEFWIGKKIARGRPALKTFLVGEPTIKRPISSWFSSKNDEFHLAEEEVLAGERQGAGTDLLMKLFGSKVFDFPKPLGLFRELIRVCASDDEVVLDFFAGSGTTGQAVLSLNDEDDGDRRFILVSNTEATAEEPEKNLCRDVCAERIRKVIAGHGGAKPLPGDFAYLRTRRLDWDDAPYDLTPDQVWLLLQLRHQRSLRPFDPTRALQSSPPPSDDPDVGHLAFIPEWSEAAEDALRELLATGPVQVFSPAPGAIRAALDLPHLAIEAAPGRLMDEFPRVIAGL